MIDLHCHLLHGIDDGPATIGETVDMCRIAYEDGVRTIVATPHFRPGSFEPSRLDIEKKTREICAAVAESLPGLSICTGADITVTPELHDHLQRFPYLTINGTGRYFLAELPSTAVPPQWDLFLMTLIRNGRIPVLTHPERSGWFLSRPEALVPFVRAGGLVQITAMSLAGDGGPDQRRYAIHLLSSNLAHVIASDAHSSSARSPVLSRAVKIASGIVGAERARRMVEDLPEKIIAGLPVFADDPVVTTPKKRTWLQRILQQ